MSNSSVREWIDHNISLATKALHEYSFSDHPSGNNKDDNVFKGMLSIPQCFNPDWFNYITRDLDFSAESSELLASRLNGKDLLEKETKIAFYRTSKKELLLVLFQADKLEFRHEIIVF